MKKTIFVLLAVLMLSGYLTPVCSAETEEAFSVDATAALLVDTNTGMVLYSKNESEQRYPASLTKIMTCMLVLESCDLSDIVTVSASALDGLDPAGSSANLQVGERMSVENLCYCIMVASANDACNVLAEYVAGSIPAFVQRMNEKAAELGCTGTHFANANGLHDPDHYTTANDLLKITEAALQNEIFQKICNTETYTVPATNLSDARSLSTSNYLISTSSNNTYYYRYASGVKTGYTSQAGRCLISTADNGDLSLIGIILGADTSILENGDVQQESFIEMADLFDYGFEHYAYVEILSEIEPVASIPVTLSAGAEEVVLVPSSEISALLPADFDKDACIFAVDVGGKETLQAPVQEGEILGSVTVSYKGQVLGSTSLVALYAVQRSDFAYYSMVLSSLTHRFWWVAVVVLVAILVLIYLYHNVRRKKRRKPQ